MLCDKVGVYLPKITFSHLYALFIRVQLLPGHSVYKNPCHKSTRYATVSLFTIVINISKV